MRLNAVVIADDGHMRHRTSFGALAGVASKVIIATCSRAGPYAHAFSALVEKAAGSLVQIANEELFPSREPLSQALHPLPQRGRLRTK